MTNGSRQHTRLLDFLRGNVPPESAEAETVLRGADRALPGGCHPRVGCWDLHDMLVAQVETLLQEYRAALLAQTALQWLERHGHHSGPEAGLTGPSCQWDPRDGSLLDAVLKGIRAERAEPIGAGAPDGVR